MGAAISVLIDTQISQYGILWSNRMAIAVVASLRIEVAATLELANAIIYSAQVSP